VQYFSHYEYTFKKSAAVAGTMNNVLQEERWCSVCFMWCNCGSDTEKVCKWCCWNTWL